MKIEEAIKIIKNYDVNGCGYCHQGGDEIEEAFNIAIKALEQELKTEKVVKIHDPTPEQRKLLDKYIKKSICITGVDFLDLKQEPKMIKEERKMKVYLSGPITGTDDYMERFYRAENRLIGRGYEVVNPAMENARLPEGTSWEEYMGESLKMLATCDAIYLMRGYMTSRGAMLEYSVAEQMGKVIYKELVK